MLRLFSSKLLYPKFQTFSPTSLNLFSTIKKDAGTATPPNNLNKRNGGKQTENRTLFSKKRQVKRSDPQLIPNFTPPQKKTQKTFEPANVAQRSGDEDIHSKRFADLSKLEGDESFLSLRNEFYKFTFDPSLKSIDVNLNDVNIVNIENEQTFFRIPKLAHGLNTILRKPGVYPLSSLLPLQKDGGKFLRYAYQPDEVDFTNIPPYTPPSKDKLLMKFAQESKIKYVMSTSTISNVLSQIYYLFSFFRNPNFGNISESYMNEPKKFMISQRKPITNFLRKVDAENGIYALDSDPGLFFFKENILMDMGKILERSLTLPAEVFERALLKSGPRELVPELEEDHHRFMKLNNEICLRSQIDCHEIDPETGQPFVFEIKTRSVCPIRYDLFNYDDYFDYRINSYRGLHSSFEREYYDLIRGGFLKYSFQLKIGRMDGAFIAYHNTKELFGFEYVKTKEIERRIFGNELYADAAFVSCSKLLIVLLNNLTDALKDEKYEMLKIGFFADSALKKMVIFTELYENPTTWDEKGLIHQTDEIKDEHDYFTKYAPMKNKVLKFEFQIFVYINGVLQKGPEHELSRGDQIEIKYKFKGHGTPSFIDYMNFLHEAYKFETVNIDPSYMGAWVK